MIARMLDRFLRREPALAQEIIRIRAGVLQCTSFDRLARDMAPRAPALSQRMVVRSATKFGRAFPAAGGERKSRPGPGHFAPLYALSGAVNSATKESAWKRRFFSWPRRF
jgi:hypothetical protein